MKAYLGGKMRGLPQLGFPLFDAAAARLRAAGWEIINPADHDRDEGIDPDTWVESSGGTGPLLLWDLQQIADESCECVIFLDNYATSSGARAERALAEALGKKVGVYEQREGDAFRITPIDVYEAAVPPTGETRVVNATTGGAKGSKLARFDLLPYESLWAVAEHYGRGAAKYEAHNWRKGYDWSLSIAALGRHFAAFVTGENIDEETGSPHMAAVAFHALSLLSFMQHHPDLDDRYKCPS